MKVIHKRHSQYKSTVLQRVPTWIFLKFYTYKLLRRRAPFTIFKWATSNTLIDEKICTLMFKVITMTMKGVSKNVREDWVIISRSIRGLLVNKIWTIMNKPIYGKTL